VSNQKQKKNRKLQTRKSTDEDEDMRRSKKKVNVKLCFRIPAAMAVFFWVDCVFFSLFSMRSSLLSFISIPDLALEDVDATNAVASSIAATNVRIVSYVGHVHAFFGLDHSVVEHQNGDEGDHDGRVSQP
jgi:hypothetical protein